MVKLFFTVLAKDGKYVKEKIEELERLKVPYVIICGERLNHPKVVHRPPRGKYDAIDYSVRLIPTDTDIVALNDVDTKIFNLQRALHYFKDEKLALVFAADIVSKGPQILFHRLLFTILRWIPIVANGDLMLIGHDVLKRIPIVPCKAEDAYIAFRVLNMGYKVVFCSECFAITEKTKSAEEDELYKRRTVAGVYQALSYIKPRKPIIHLIKIFYILLPFLSPLLLITGKMGYHWMRGILLGFMDYLRGDWSGVWEPTYI